MLNYILPALIFVSLGVIVFIVGKHLPDLKKAQKDNDFDKKNFIFKQKIFNIFLIFFRRIKKTFIFLAEKIIKKTKKTLHLVHFWLIKIKKGKDKNDEFYNDMEAKEQLIREEEDELDHVINEDLASADEQDLIKKEQEKRQAYDLEDIKKERNQEEQKNQVDDYYLNNNEKNNKAIAEKEEFKKEILDELEKEDKNEKERENRKSHQKVKNFFLEEDDYEDETVEIKSEVFQEEKIEDNLNDFEELELQNREELSEESKKGRFSGFIANIFKRSRNKDKIEEENYTENNSENDQFSDGIVKIEEYEKPREKENLLIKEVVRVERDGADIDDELGVDRKILEKKLIQKIVKSPKQIENYRQLGELYIKVENYIEAVECYKQILKIYPRDVDSKRKLEKISFLRRVKKGN